MQRRFPMPIKLVHWRKALFLMGIMALALLQAANYVSISVLDQLDRMWYDTLVRSSPPSTKDTRITIVDVDEKSLKEIGRWPWDRRLLAKLVNELVDRQRVSVVGFDFVFSDADQSSGLQHLQDLAHGRLSHDAQFQKQVELLTPELSFDALFAHAMENRPVVLGYYLTSDRDQAQRGRLPSPVMTGEALRGLPLSSTHWDGYGGNIDTFMALKQPSGFFNAIADRDGVVRTLPLLAEYQGEYYESLALAMFRVALEFPTVHPVFSRPQPHGTYDILRAIELRQQGRAFQIPVDDRLGTLVPFLGKGGPSGGAFQYISAADVLMGRLPANALDNQMVLVGSTAPGLQDLRATPVDNVYPGVEIHANMLAALFDGHYWVVPDYAPAFNVLQIFLVGGLLMCLAPRLSAARVAVLGGLLSVSVVVLNLVLFGYYGVVLPMASVLVLVLMMLLFEMAHGYWIETRAKRNLAALFGTYVPPELVVEMLKEPEQYSMEAKNRELTVMFCDIRGFTAMSESMPPIQLQALLTTIFSQLTHTIRQEYQGTIDKYMGDCIMAFWGAPVPHAKHAHQAIAAAVAMGELIRRINQQHQQQHLPTIGVGIGVNTGVMCVGDMGSDIRRSYTVIGDAVNLGSRLEGLSKTYGVDIIVSQSTCEQAPDWYWQELDRVRVKGKAQAVSIYHPVRAKLHADDPAEVLVQQELAQWTACLQCYRQQAWAICLGQLALLRSQFPDKRLYALYEEDVQRRMQLPHNPQWDAVTNFESK